MREKLPHRDHEKLERARGYHLSGDFANARSLYEKLLRKHPKHPAVQALLGTVLIDQGEPVKAIPLLKRSTTAVRSPDNHYNLALAFDAVGDLPAAIKQYEKALALHPHHAKAHFNLGLAYRRQGNHEAAITALLADYEQAPSFDTCRLLTRSYTQLERFDEALFYANRCVELEGANPDDLDALIFLLCHNYAFTAYVNDEQQAELIALSDHAVKLNSANVTAQVNAGRALSLLGQFDAALPFLKQAVQLDPENASAHALYAVALLTCGHLREGWHERTVIDRMQNPTSSSGVPRWQGQLTEGLKIWITDEQGIGDQILYSQMFNDLIAAGIQITFVCEPRMQPLMMRTFPAIKVATALSASEQQQHDAFATLGELHMYLRPQVDQLPEPTAYLRPDEGRVAELRNLYVNRYPGKTITGLSWHSHGAVNGAGKSIPLDDLLPILQDPSRVFVCVQYGEGWEELRAHAQHHDYQVHFDANCNSLEDLDAGLAQLAALDELVAVSNASVHMAGALGMPVYVLVGKRPVWHWFSDGERSPWYTQARLYRQQNLTDWQAPIAALAQDLQGP